MSKSEQRATVFGHELNFDQRAARGQIAAALPSPSERDAAVRCDFRISRVRNVRVVARVRFGARLCENTGCQI